MQGVRLLVSDRNEIRSSVVSGKANRRYVLFFFFVHVAFSIIKKIDGYVSKALSMKYIICFT